MLCDTCRWTGRPGFVRAPRQALGRDQVDDHCGMIPCPDCGGQGIAHCCDGVCEQPGAGSAEHRGAMSAPVRADKRRA